MIAEKTDAAGRRVRQIELCRPHCEIVIERGPTRGLEICDRRNEYRRLPEDVRNRIMQCERDRQRGEATRNRGDSPAVSDGVSWTNAEAIETHDSHGKLQLQ